MKNYRKHIDDFFREKLGWYSETPPPDVWDELDGRLDTLKPVVHHAPYRMLWHFAIVSGILVLGVSIAVKIYRNRSAGQQIVAVSSEQKTGAADRSSEQGQQTEAVSRGSEQEQQTETVSRGSRQEQQTEAVSRGSRQGQQIGAEVRSSKQGQEANAVQDAVKANGKASNTSHPIASAKHVGNNKNAPTNSQSSAIRNEQTAKPEHESNNYNSSIANNNGAGKKPAESAKAENNNNEVNAGKAAPTNTLPASNKTEIKPDALKKDNTDSAKKSVADEKKKAHSHPLWLKKFELGVKGGYESGLDDRAANKYVISPYLQYNLSKKIAVMIQPAAKYATLTSKQVGGSYSYNQPNADGKMVQDGPSTITTVVDGGNIDTFYKTKYTYSQSHDSIVKSDKRGGSYMEFEIPLLLKYSIMPKLSVYGGINVVFSKVTAITEQTYTKQGIVRSLDTTITTLGSIGVPPPVSAMTPYLNDQMHGDGSIPVYNRAEENKITAGYMLGFSYEYSRRLLFDALITQNPYKPYIVGGYNANMPISSPYFRLSVGYKITK